jgi:hypothetical protein
MRALIRKEITELLVPFGPILLVLFLVWLRMAKLEDVLLAPRLGPAAAVLFTAAVVGWVVACVQFLGERIRGTWGFLLHRGSGHARCFRAKAIAGMSTALAFAILPPLVFALWHAFVLGEARVVQWTRVWELACLSTLGASAYAVAALMLQLRRRIIVDLGLASIGVLGLHVLSAASLDLPGGITTAFIRYVLFHLIAASALLWVASRAFEVARDRELPLATPIQAAVLVLSILLILPVMFGLLGGLESELSASSQGDAQFFAMDRTSEEVIPMSIDKEGEWKRVDGNRRVPDDRLRNFKGLFSSTENIALLADSEPRDWRPTQSAFQSILRLRRLNWRWSALNPWFFRPGYSCSIGRFRTECWLDTDCGHVRVFGISHGPEGGREIILEDDQAPAELPFAMELAKPGNPGRFSEATLVLHPLQRFIPSEPKDLHVLGAASSYVEDLEAKTILLVDRQDGTLTSIDRMDFRNPIRKVELPDGDRFVGVEELFDRSRLELGWEMAHPAALIGCDSGLYEWRNDSLSRFDMNLEGRPVTKEEAKTLIQHWIVTTDPDSVEAGIEVRDPKSGRTLLAYRYGTRDLGDRVRVTAVQALSLLRSPIGMVLSFFRDTHGARPETRSADALFEPLLMNRSRVGLLVVALIAAAIQVLSILGQLRYRQSATVVIVIAVLMVVSFGFTAWLLVRLLEPRRHRSSVHSVARVTEETALLIRSA